MFEYYMPFSRLTPERRELLRDDSNFIGGILILVMTFLTFVYSLIASFLFPYEALLLPDLGLGDIGYLLFYGCIYMFSMGTPVLFCSLLFDRSPRALMTARPVRFTTGAAAVLVGMGGCVIANMVASVLSVWLQNYGIESPEVPTFLDGTPHNFLLNLFVWAVLPALLEELIFRVCILGSLRKYGDWFAIILSAVLFGAIHGGIAQSVFALLVGLVFGYITVSTGNVWLAIIIHFCNNGLSLLLEYVTLSMEDMTAGALYTLLLLTIGLIGAVVLIGCAILRSPLLRKPSPAKGSTGEMLSVFVKSPLVIIAVILIVLRMIESSLI